MLVTMGRLLISYLVGVFPPPTPVITHTHHTEMNHPFQTHCLLHSLVVGPCPGALVHETPIVYFTHRTFRFQVPQSQPHLPLLPHSSLEVPKTKCLTSAHKQVLCQSTEFQLSSSLALTSSLPSLTQLSKKLHQVTTALSAVPPLGPRLL